MQINLTVHIHLDGADLEGALLKLAALATGIKSLDSGGPPPAPEVEAVQAPDPSAAPDRVTNPTTKIKKRPPEKRPAMLPGEVEKPARMTSDRLPFAEFDQLVRTEMKRLSLDRRMPGHKFWDGERDKRLPTLGAVLYRYNVTTLADLADRLDLLPPLSVTPGVKVAA